MANALTFPTHSTNIGVFGRNRAPASASVETKTLWIQKYQLNVPTYVLCLKTCWISNVILFLSFTVVAFILLLI